VKPFKPCTRKICPKLGSLVRARPGGPLDPDINLVSRVGLVINTRGIEVRVMTESGMLVWVRRDSLDVISTLKWV
jgi:hypothetical protein